MKPMIYVTVLLALLLSCAGIEPRQEHYTMLQAGDAGETKAPSASTSSLIEAVKNNNLEQATTAIDQGADLNVLVEGNAILYKAIHQGSFDIAALLVKRGANLGTRDTQNQDPAVVSALRNKQRELANLMIDRGADIEAGDTNSTNALHWAAWHNYTDTVQKCINRNVNLNTQIYDGSTALMLAVYRNHEATVDLILSKNPGLDYQNTEGRTAIMLACSQNFNSVSLKLIRAGANINIADQQRYTPLMLACQFPRGNLQDDQFLPAVLIQRGANVNAKSTDGMTALMLATRSNNTDAIELLKKNGAKE